MRKGRNKATGVMLLQSRKLVAEKSKMSLIAAVTNVGSKLPVGRWWHSAWFLLSPLSSHNRR